MNRIFLIVCTFTLLTAKANAQISGGSAGGTKSTEVKASDINAGGVSGDVNVFSGTFNTSYTLGTVNTRSGLSFTASISHSSTYTNGDNPPNLSGVPYGEGWNLNVPTISVSTEDFNKYTLYQTFNLQSSPGLSGIETPLFTSSESGAEGSLSWFAPQLNIPGVASGRLIYKRQEQIDGVGTFTLAEFDNYVEVKLSGGTWVVTTSDGTLYTFDTQMGSERSPVNQRSTPGNNTTSNTIAGGIFPKLDVTTWYLSSIRHLNKLGQIEFKYKTGGFFYDAFSVHSDFYKEFMSTNSAILNRDKPVARDIILKSIESDIEKLVLDYSVMLQLPKGSNLLPATNTISGDVMYCKKTIKLWNFNNGTDGSDWDRFLHLKSQNIGANISGISPTNPYTGSLTNSGLPGQVMVKESALNVGSISNGSGLKFTYDANNGEMRSGFLSSPRFGSSSLTPAGDLYEVKFNMNAFDESTFYLNLFDVNLATGDNRVNASSSGPNVLNADCYKEKYGASVYSTFQHAAKWAMTPLLPSNQIKVFSNFFTMPNLPNEFGGFNIQIGPANSDNDCSADKNKVSGNTNANPDYKLTYPSYGSSGMPNGGGALKSGDLIPNNFGIGVFWSAMNWFYHP